MNLISETVVVVAQKFNPSIIGEHWLIANAIVQEDELLPTRVFTPVFAQCGSDEFELLVTEDRLQLSLRNQNANQQRVVDRIAKSIVERLPETPYKGIGLNFVWHQPVEDGCIHDESARLFLNATSPLASAFAEESCHYGGYFSKSFGDFRLKLTALPSKIAGTEDAVISYSFNFHAEVTTHQEVARLLSEWQAARAEAIDCLTVTGKYQ